MARANQGVRQDLNFQEIENEVVALGNLSEVSLSDDLRIIQNNLRNTSRLAFNSVLTSTDEFVFNTDKTLSITSGTAESSGSSTEVTIEVSPAYNTYSGEVITITGFVGTGSDTFNGTYQTIKVGTGGTTLTYRKTNSVFDGTGTLSGSGTAVIKSGTNFVYTNDDIVRPSIDVSVGSTTLSAGTDYFICKSDAETKFQVSFTPSTNVAGINTVDVTAVPAQFDFIRQEPVIKRSITNFQRPEIQDEQEFGTYLANGINGSMELAQANGENANYFIGKKYKGTEDTTVDTEIKFEGTVNLFDPIGFNANSGDLELSNSPGIFIGNTRAFSADNNPWTPSLPDLETDSYEVSIADLEFAKGDAASSNASHGFNIEGISQQSTGSAASFNFTHKIPVTIAGEVYYLLMKQS